MSASLVGSEMCIRDRPPKPRRAGHFSGPVEAAAKSLQRCCTLAGGRRTCLLYTSDAADDM
eukprot:471486-Alexandrium_andersonii.AAC.1